MMLALAALHWTHPVGLLALTLPLLLLVLSMRRSRPAPSAVGTYALWAAVARAAPPRGPLSRWHVPLERWLFAAALALGALALGGPQPERRERALPWRVVVDRSPSMYLAHTDERGVPSGSDTRLSAALGPALRWLDSIDGGAPREWIDPASVDGASLLQREPPREWLVAPAEERSEPRWTLHDREGAVWITDRAPGAASERANLFASGGGAVPGAIGASGTTELVWDGERVSEHAGALSPGRIVLAAGLPELLADFARIWATARGLVEEGGGPVLLEVQVVGEGAELELACSRDGWSTAARGRAGGVPTALEGRALEPWLVGRAGDRDLRVVGWRRGRVVTSLVSCDEPRGDPALFALSWTELFDRALAPRPGIVSVAERASAGTATAAPRGAPRFSPRGAEPFPLTALLTGLSAALALLAGSVSIARA